MLTKTQFFNKYLGKSVEYDGVAEFQCVDIVKMYLKKCYGISPGSWGDAKYYGLYANNKKWNGYKQMHEYFTWHEGRTVPERGDIVVFNGTYGHVGIATGKNTSVKTMELFEQNWSNKKYVTKNSHFFTDMIGLWRPKFYTVTEDLNIRSSPSSQTYDNIIGLYTKGSFVEVLEKKYSWWKTPKGYVFKNYLD